MCRLLGYVSNEERTFVDVVGEGFENFVELSKEHKRTSKDMVFCEIISNLTVNAIF
jgi:hypothetical protein